MHCRSRSPASPWNRGAPAQLTAAVTDPDGATVGEAGPAATGAAPTALPGPQILWLADGQPIAAGASAQVSFLQPGVYRLVARATDAFGATAEVATDLAVTGRRGDQTLPVIRQPAAPVTVVFAGDAVQFEAVGVPPGADVAWVSSLQGRLGAGPSLQAELQPGTHRVALVVDGLEVESRTVEVQPSPGAEAEPVAVVVGSCRLRSGRSGWAASSGKAM